MFTQALQDIGLTTSKHDPCLIAGVVAMSPSSSNEPNRVSVHVGIYVDDFIYYSTDPMRNFASKRNLRSVWSLTSWVLWIDFLALHLHGKHVMTATYLSSFPKQHLQNSLLTVLL